MKTVPLSQTQRFGFGVLKQNVIQAHSAANKFIETCLRECGGDLTQPWRWNEEQLQWELDDDGSPK